MTLKWGGSPIEPSEILWKQKSFIVGGGSFRGSVVCLVEFELSGSVFSEAETGRMNSGTRMVFCSVISKGGG